MKCKKVFRPDNVKGLTKQDIELLGSGIYPDKLLRRASAQGVDGLLTVMRGFCRHLLIHLTVYKSI